MMLPVLQIAAVIAIALYLVRWRKSVRRRNSQTWDTLMARLRSEWSARELSDHFLWQEGLSATPEDAWRRMEGPSTSAQGPSKARPEPGAARAPSRVRRAAAPRDRASARAPSRASAARRRTACRRAGRGVRPSRGNRSNMRSRSAFDVAARAARRSGAGRRRAADCRVTVQRGEHAPVFRRMRERRDA